MRSGRRGTWVVALLSVSLVALAATTQTWVTIVPASPSVKLPDIDVPGNKASTLVSALAMVGVACAAALSISRRWGVWIACAAAAAAGVGLAASVVSVALDPVGAARLVVGEATGTSTVDGSSQVGVFPWVAAAAGFAMALTALGAGWTARSWAAGSRADRRFTRAGTPVGTRTGLGPSAAGGESADSHGHGDAIDDWDTLSRGEDPTADRSRPQAP